MNCGASVSAARSGLSRPRYSMRASASVSVDRRPSMAISCPLMPPRITCSISRRRHRPQPSRRARSSACMCPAFARRGRGGDRRGPALSTRRRTRRPPFPGCRDRPGAAHAPPLEGRGGLQKAAENERKADHGLADACPTAFGSGSIATSYCFRSSLNRRSASALRLSLAQSALPRFASRRARASGPASLH